MSNLVKEIDGYFNSSKMDIEKLLDCEKRLIDEYNEITKEHKRLFSKIETEIKTRRLEIIANCEHKYIRYSEYHNDCYFICEKCHHEK